MSPPTSYPSQAEPIAIVGSGCRFPGGASSPSKLWELLREPRDVLQEIPPSRFDTRGFHHPDPQFPGHTNVRHSYLLSENVRQFDANFFSIKGVEASAMDPQHRLLLETVYEGLESAGLTIDGLKGSDTGVYVGMMYGDYEALQFRDLQRLPIYHSTGNARSIISNRISYFFDWRGPSLTVDTACSSSLVALHQAVQALRSGEVHVAIAAGSNLLLGPEHYIAESKLKMLSSEGRSRMWDHNANGYARGDGVATVVLKTLTEALAAGDNIECVIRETGVNQDGRTRGITMPSATAQATLIRETYAKAGLSTTTDRCQYFEAHGTGTPAGDPIEAEAVHAAFFAEGEGSPNGRSDTPLFVGSIKTIIGHTESTAGLAGILKTAQAMKHGYIPPNLLLNELNPEIRPFYNHLQIPKKLTPWPQPPVGQPRRASVNSFGFGGTNAHVIMESIETVAEDRTTEPLSSPFLFSAHSKQSLGANLAAFAEFLEQHPETSATDLAWTLRKRRSRLPLRVTFPASSIEDLRLGLNNASKDLQLEPRSAGSGTQKPRILGVFTGQGAQYARMGAELIQTSQYAADILAELDSALAQLPEGDVPSWTFKEELLADAQSSRLGSATISQPLCTAVQIVLVRLLRLAGIEFAAVVGHSSGEIAAAFAAGYLSEDAAIRIAYYRGLHSKLAAGPDGAPGAMLAAGTSFEDASELCNEAEFKGRVSIAASNSPSSVTLSGDVDAIAEMEALFEDENKFHRRLKVDKAYHSHHMRACSKAYLEALHNFPITVQKPELGCVWVSSVYPDQPLNSFSTLDGSYWDDNLTSPVLFMQAIERAMSLGPFDAAVEVGPHPALKGPVRETLQGLEIELPYTGLLQRNNDAVKSISNALGHLWVVLDNVQLDFDRYEAALGGPSSCHFVPGLPTYQWNHDKEYWHESRFSRSLRQRQHSVHPLLGNLSPDSSPHQLMWKHTLRLQDLPWITGHQIEGQNVFPAAGYLATVLETVPFISGEKSVNLIEIHDFVISQATVFIDDDLESGIETLIAVNNISRDKTGLITSQFTYSTCSNDQDTFDLVASGELHIILGEASPQILPDRGPNEPYMIPVPSELFYSELAELGYGYSGPFKGLSDLKRKHRKAAGLVALTPVEPADTILTIHPAMLDSAVHSVLLAMSYPKDGQLWSLHVPTSVQRIRVNPSLCGSNWMNSEHVPFLASVLEDDGKPGFTGDVEVFGSNGQNAAIQLEGVHVVPLTQATSANDRKLFYTMRWSNAEPDVDIPEKYRATAEEYELAYTLERGSCFYLRKLEQEIPSDHPGRLDKFNAAYLNFASHINKLVSQGKHPYAKKEWLNDTLEDILTATEPFSNLPEVKAMHVVGKEMPRAIRGETSILEHLMHDGLLDNYYATALGLGQVTDRLADTTAQIARRYPSMKILEIGAGTGGATRQIFNRIGHDFASYTYTDISSGFFGNAQTEFAPYNDQMSYAILDLEQDVQKQGFEEHSYDLIVASLVVHATKNLEQSTRRIRSLLKPGGYLILSELTNDAITRGTFIFGCLPGWWLGQEEGRTLSPAVNESKWDAILRKTGFSGVDTMTPTQDSLPFANSVLVSQAVDDWVDFIREPLLAQPSLTGRSVIEHLYIVGGNTIRVSRLIQEIQKLLGIFCGDITKVQTIEELDHTKIGPNTTTLVLEELDRPVFKDLTPGRFNSLKELFGSEKTILWVTQNRRIDNPYSNMPIGLARSVRWEVPDLRLQFIDFEDVSKIDSRILTEALLRFQVSGTIEQQNQRKPLFSIESEIVVDSNGRQLIPRLRPFGDANDRYNSTRRSVLKESQPQASPVVISKADGHWALHEQSFEDRGEAEVSKAAHYLKLSRSSLHAIKTSVGRAFLVLGTSGTDNLQYLGVSESPASLMKLGEDSLVPVSVAPSSESLFLSLVTANLLAPVLLDTLTEGETLLVHNAPILLANTITRQAQEVGIIVFYTTSDRSEAAQRDWIYVDQNLRQAQLKSLVPSTVARFIDLTPMEQPYDHHSTISAALSKYCQVEDARTLFTHTASAVRHSAKSGEKATEVLERAVISATAELSDDQCNSVVPNELSLQDLAMEGKSYDPLTVVDWTASSSVSTTVEPAKPTFKPNRTYWLVGLSGDMGLSLADWMVAHGARHLVITSRNPRIDSAWIESTERKGATIRVFSNDLTNFDSVQDVYHMISTTLPPIAGVAQGAMVLKDMATRDMKYEDMMAVLRPKVDGSLNLDRLFNKDTLDFFIFFSSTANVIGNLGQASYTAANLFMCGLAQQRRHRGLAASVIDLGTIIGAGYITREMDEAGQKAMFNRGFLPMAEPEVHHIFAEATRSGQPDSGEESEIVSALRELPASDPNRPFWYSYPEFACATAKDPRESTGNSNEKGAISIKDQLLGATTKDELRRIILETFSNEMRNMLQLGSDYEITPSVRTDELGLDSLIAVRVRSFFLNNYQVNIPALKILRGVSVGDLVQQALEEIPEESVPNLGSPEVTDEVAKPELKEASSGAQTSSSASGTDTPPSTYAPTEISSDDKGDVDKVGLEKDDRPPIVELKRFGPLSFSQSMFWFVHELLDDKKTLNNSGIFHLRGEIRIPDLSRAVEALGHRHEALRTCFCVRDGQIAQGIMESSHLTLEHKKIYGQKDLANEYESLKNQVWDLSRGKAIRLVLLSYSLKDHYLLMAYHHLIFDGASHHPFMIDLERIYNGEEPTPDPLQYLDYSNQEREQYLAGSWKPQIAFWRREFTSIPEPLPLYRSQLTRRRPMARYKGRTTDFRVENQLASQIRNVARTYRCTPFHLYLAALKVLLFRFLGTNDICIGIADSSRREEHMRTAVGPFLNLLPLRMEAKADQPFSDAMQDAREKSFSVLSNSLPLEVILNELQVARSPTYAPLFQCFLNYLESNIEERQTFIDCTMEMLEQDPAELAYDMTFTIMSSTVGDTRVILKIQESLYSDEDAQLIARGYEDILREFVATPSQQIGDEWRFREEDLEKAVSLGRGPNFECTWPETVVHQLEAIIPTFSDRLAVKDSDGTCLSYKQLSERIDTIATELLRQGVEPGSRVAIFQQPKVDWVPSVMAILKIGAVYVPLDAGTPAARLALIVDDCQPVAIIVHGPTLDLTDGLRASAGTSIVNVSTLSEASGEDFSIRARQDAPAIILYTSGSTGTPKGVVLRHSSLRHEFDHCAFTYGLTKFDVVLQQSAWSFDLSVTQLFLALGVGASLCIVSHDMRVDSRAMVEVIRDEGVTTAYATPTEYKSWLRREHQDLLKGTSWRLSLVAGEAVTEPLLQLFRELDRPELRLFNVYGPTETTCGSTKTEMAYRIPGFYQGVVPVGRASANESFYIVDDKLHLQPVGQLGEVVIGGVGVAQGYLNNDERTQASFVPDPYVNDEFVRYGWTTMYRTGDLGRLTTDGTLILKGRIGDDTEVKINGVRIDLKDVEQTILRSANGYLTDAIATVRSTADGSSKFMVAHVVFSSNDELGDEDTFLRKLSEELPLSRQMRPSAIVPMASFPRTVAGKVDRKAIASMPIQKRALETISNRSLSKAETEMLSLWKKVIPDELAGLHEIEADSDFFNVGGSSMLLIELQGLIRDKLGLSPSLIELFQASTLRSMGTLLAMDEAESSVQIDWAEETAPQSDLRIETDQPDAGTRMPPKVVILTGATGFLGKHLLQALIEQQEVQKIVCIAIRNLDDDRRAILSSSKKTEFYEGDLRQPRLGLSKETASRIFREADAVVHNGADVSHLKTYSSLRSANVTSTQDLVQLCLPRKTPIHYISTTGTTMYTNASSFPEASVRNSKPPTDGMYGYVASKWASEVYLERIHEYAGLPVFIHRPSSIIRPEEDMVGENMAPDVLQNMLAYSRHLRAVPTAVGLHGTLDLVHPRTVVQKAVNAVMNQNDGVVFLHESGDLELDIEELQTYLEKETKGDVEKIAVDEWIARAEEIGLSSAMAAVFKGLQDAEGITFPKLLRKEL